MRIYPINQSAVVFRGYNKGSQNHSMKRYCEPRTGAYYYYDASQAEKLKSQNSFSIFFNNLKKKFSGVSESAGDTFIHRNLNSSNSDDTTWL